MTNMPYRATWPKGRSSESAVPTQNHEWTYEQSQKNYPSAIRTPGAGLPQWPAPGARWQYGGRCSSKQRDNKVSRGRLTDTTWTKVGLRPNLRGPSIFTNKKQSSRIFSDDPPSPPKVDTQTDREHKRIFFQTDSFTLKSKASQRRDFFKNLKK